MIEITDKTKCCGCDACGDICPKNCISYEQDAEGFHYPKVDLKLCINCHLCEKVCPEIHNEPVDATPIYYAAQSRNKESLMNSTSGGIYGEISETILKDGGVVCGARFDENWNVVHDISESSYDKFKGSKYVQSRVENQYTAIRRYLQAGRKVLFSGTPCQVRALHNFLGRRYENLFTVDFICHGIPSVSVWQKYLKNWWRDSSFKSSTCAYVDEGNKIIGINFRDKMQGWQFFHLTICAEFDGKPHKFYSKKKENAYMKAFLNDIILRPSCYECPVKDYNSGSDVTLGDLWGASKIVDWDIKDGVSAIVINTKAGQKLFDGLNLQKVLIEEDSIISQNPSLRKAVQKPLRREKFFKALRESSDIITILNKYSQPPLKSRIRSKIIIFIKYIGLLKLLRK